MAFFRVHFNFSYLAILWGSGLINPLKFLGPYLIELIH